jgi:hypothetical protein
MHGKPMQIPNFIDCQFAEPAGGRYLDLARLLDMPRAASNSLFFATAILSAEPGADITNDVRFVRYLSPE